VLVPISVSVLTQIKIWSTLMLILLAAHRGGLCTLFFAGIIAVGFVHPITISTQKMSTYFGTHC
jgi:hypothetical protein